MPLTRIDAASAWWENSFVLGAQTEKCHRAMEDMLRYQGSQPLRLNPEEGAVKKLEAAPSKLLLLL